MRDLIENRNFLLHWIGAAFFQTGNFFSLVAFPWLMLSITGNDPISATTIMAAVSLPHGFFVLFGGVLADKISPIRLLYYSRVLFFIVMCSFSILVYMQNIPVWLIYFYAFLTGTLGSVGFPAVQSLLPSLVDKKDLGYANAIIMGTNQLAHIVGPILAGWLIWLGRTQTSAQIEGVPYTGLALAFFVDSLAALMGFFLIINLTKLPLSFVKSADEFGRLFTQGFTFCWKDTGVRIVLFYILLVSFFLHGPLLACLPIFTKVTLGLSEGAYGSLYAMLGFGTVLGAVIGATKISVERNLGVVVLTCNFFSALAFLSLSYAGSVWVVALLLVVMGLGSGVVMIAGTTWFQIRTPPALMGRVMGVLMFTVIGLMPISATLSGYLISASSIAIVFILAGGIVLIVAALGLLVPRIRGMGDIAPLQEDDFLHSESSSAVIR